MRVRAARSDLELSVCEGCYDRGYVYRRYGIEARKVRLGCVLDGRGAACVGCDDPLLDAAMAGTLTEDDIDRHLRAIEEGV